MKIENLKLPVRYESDSIVDANGKEIIKAVRDSSKTPLMPFERDNLLQWVVDLINDAWKTKSLKEKAKKYDELVIGVSQFYPEDDTTEESDLVDIGEYVARQLGFM